tara:strand:+ start:18271 stop:20001 length:1731 start_codon:yes stop_codon:yes gene_type:complete
MGIPKYFRHITKKYPNLILNKTNDIVIDNLFFDLNCLIHPCVNNVSKNFQNLVILYNKEISSHKYYNLDYISELEKKIYEEISEYMEKLISYISPAKSVYISIDGVAPRAKMEQQRLRRYRSIKIKEMRRKILHKYNKTEVVFDTNCITPGTIFMKKLQMYLEKYIKVLHKKYAVKIILDGSNIRGEGEHKILQYIKSYSTADINCIYGLDADLIMLSLVSNSKVYLLREAVHFGKVNMNEYLLFDVEEFTNKLYENIYNKFKALNKTFDNIYCIEELELDKQSLIKDYVCLCFLIGNDFIPPILGVDIHNKSINSLLDIYCKIFLVRQVYLISLDNKVNYIFIRQIFTYLYSIEDEYIPKHQRKIDKFRFRSFSKTKLDKELDRMKFYPVLNKNTAFKLGDDNWRNTYYKYYFNVDNIFKNKDYMDGICKNYIEGLQWNAYYYFDKCVSYSWYYKYRSAPLLKDLTYLLIKRIYPVKFEDIEYSALEQLNIVLPIQSSHLWYEEFKLNVKKDLKLSIEYPTYIHLDTLNKIYLHECNPILFDIDNTYIKQLFENSTLTILEKNLNEKGTIITIES